MKRFFLSAALMLGMLATANAGRVYIFHDDFAKPLGEGETKVQYDAIWSWESDGGGFGIASAADEGVLPGSMYVEYTCQGGWAGGNWVFNDGNNIDLSGVTDDDTFVMYVKTTQPAEESAGKASVFSFEVKGANGTSASFDLHDYITARDYTWNKIEIPVYELMDKGWQAGVVSGNPCTFLTVIMNTTGGNVKFAFDEMYFTVGGDATALHNTSADALVEKTIENGQLVILKNGVRYNAQGAQL